MREIESIVKLPAGAGSLEEYSRNYVLRPDGKVVAIYVVPHEPKAGGSDYGCDVILEDFSSRPCTAAEQAESVSRDEEMAVSFGKAGHSRWLDNDSELPRMLDGGCMLVEIIYDPRTRQIESAECNGEV